MSLMFDRHPAHTESTAVFSEDRRYRYLLTRRWGRGLLIGDADSDRARAVASRVWRHCREREGTVAVLGWTAGEQPCHPLCPQADASLCTLIAGAHPGFVDVDRRWTQLLTDTPDLDDGAAWPELHGSGA